MSEPGEVEYCMTPAQDQCLQGPDIVHDLAPRDYRRSGTQAIVLRSSEWCRACSVALRAWIFKPRGDCFDSGEQILQCRWTGRRAGVRQRGRRIEWTLGLLWIQPRDRRAVQMSTERGIPAFSGRVDGGIGNARL